MSDEESGLFQSLRDKLGIKSKAERERELVDRTIREVRKYSDVYRGAVDLERYMELESSNPDPFRVQNYYYEAARQMQRVEDELFNRLNPEAANVISGQLEQVDSRWNKVVLIAQGIAEIIRRRNPSPGAIIDTRTKSNFGIWAKMKEKDLDLDEIFDKLGIRIIVNQSEQAFLFCEQLQTNFQLMQQHKFRHRPETHSPIRDTLSSPKPTFYAAINMNLVDANSNIFEVQISTRQAFLDMHTKPAIPMQSILGYKGK